MSMPTRAVVVRNVGAQKAKAAVDILAKDRKEAVNDVKIAHRSIPNSLKKGAAGLSRGERKPRGGDAADVVFPSLGSAYGCVSQ